MKPNHKSLFHLMLVLVVLFGLTLSGCGGGGGDTGNADPVVSDPVIPDPGIPEPVIPDPLIPDPVIPDPVIPDPVIPDPQPLTFTNFQAASVVIGQSDFTGAAPNQGGPAAADTFDDNYGNPVVHNGVLYLPDWFNSRVLGFNSVPTSDGASAHFVLGQPDFATITTGTSQSDLGGPQSLSVDNSKFFMTDTDNSRILIYDTVPTSGPGRADAVVGQPNFSSDLPATTASGLSSPEAPFAVAGKLIVADSDNNRVMIWDSIPTDDGIAAHIVLGQDSFTRNAANDKDQDGFEDIPSTPSAQTLSYPTGVWSDGTRLVVLDSGNHRALIWDRFPTESFTPATLVLGQADFNLNAPNDDDGDGFEDTKPTDPSNPTNPTKPTNRTLDFPYIGVFSKDGQLFIADNSNDRVLIWDSFPIDDFTPADRVLGQSDFSGATGNDDNHDGTVDATPSANTLNNPRGVFVEGNKLIVSDGLNNRYLIYEGL